MPDLYPPLSPKDLSQLIGTADCPVVIDCRIDEDVDLEPRLLPTAHRRSAFQAADWAMEYQGCAVILYCHKGLKVSQGAAAWLRHHGVPATVLTGGIVGWKEADLPLISTGDLPNREGEGRTVWVAASRPGVPQLACAWLIRRFIDPAAVFLFVDASEVGAVADRFGAMTFEGEHSPLNNSEDRTAFDVMLEEFGLTSAPLQSLAALVRGTDRSPTDPAPQAAGLQAALSGFTQIHSEDLVLLEQGILLYDAFYLWARDAGVAA